MLDTSHILEIIKDEGWSERVRMIYNLLTPEDREHVKLAMELPLFS